jgi:hypothetical protein
VLDRSKDRPADGSMYVDENDTKVCDLYITHINYMYILHVISDIMHTYTYLCACVHMYVRMYVNDGGARQVKG